MEESNRIKKGDWFTIAGPYVNRMDTTKDKAYECISVLSKDEDGGSGSHISFHDDAGDEEWHFNRVMVKVKPPEPEEVDFTLQDGMLFRNRQNKLWRVKFVRNRTICHLLRESDDNYMKTLNKVEVIELFKEGKWTLEPEETKPVPLPLTSRKYLIGKKVRRGGSCIYTIEDMDGDDQLKITYRNGAPAYYSREKVCKFLDDGKWTFVHEDDEPSPVDYLIAAEARMELYGASKDTPKIPTVITGDTIVSGSNMYTPEKEMLENTTNEHNIALRVNCDTAFQEQTVVTVYGQNIEAMTEEQIYTVLTTIADKQNKLKEMNKEAKSARITGQITELGKARNKIVSYLDALPDSAKPEKKVKAVKKK